MSFIEVESLYFYIFYLVYVVSIINNKNYKVQSGQRQHLYNLSTETNLRILNSRTHGDHREPLINFMAAVQLIKHKKYLWQREL